MAEMKSVLTIYFCVLIIVACAYANPLPERDNRPRSMELEQRNSQEDQSMSSDRRGRHGYPYYSYDYYPDPYHYYGNYYLPQPPARPAYDYYPSYLPAQRPQTHNRYQYRPNSVEGSNSLDYKKTHRRQYKPNRGVQATTQKYTIWDLAK